MLQLSLTYQQLLQGCTSIAFFRVLSALQDESCRQAWLHDFFMVMWSVRCPLWELDHGAWCRLGCSMLASGQCVLCVGHIKMFPQIKVQSF